MLWFILWFALLAAAFAQQPAQTVSTLASIAAAPVKPGHPQMSYLAAARFLEQASWGPNAESINHLQDVGFDAWLAEQFAAPPSLYKDSDYNSENLTVQQSEFFVHATAGLDQLRQRMAFALRQIAVVSGMKTGQPRQMVPYQNMLLEDAFGTYAKLLRDVTLSPTMGVYLDMVNNDKPATGQHANENYARELMQLFTIGTALLNEDGSLQLDSSNNPIPTYTQAQVQEFALAYTGWTYPDDAGRDAAETQPGVLDRPDGRHGFQPRHNFEAAPAIHERRIRRSIARRPVGCAGS